MATLITKNSSTASAVPAAGDLVKGELAVNVTDKKVYTKDNSAAVVKLVGSLGNQEANAVAVTGGTINGTTIGATTPSTGAFTTASASSGFTGNLTGNVTGNVSGTAANVTGVVAIANGGTGLSALGTGVQSALGQAVTGSGSFVLSTSPSLTTPNLGTPSAAVLTNATGLPLTTGVTGTLGVANGGTGITAFGTGVATALGQNVTGSGGIVLATSPSLTTPNLGTPSAATLTNATGLPIATGVSGLGTGVATALGVAVGSAGAFVVNGGALGTPSSGTLTNATGLPLSTGVTGTLATTNGGTGLTSFTANGVVYASSSSALTTGSALTFTGTNLGIGVPSPTVPLDVNGSIKAVGANSFALSLAAAAVNDSIWMRFLNSAGTRRAYFGFGSSGDSTMTLSNDENGAMVFQTNATEQMRLTSTGLGIGTSSPGYRLDVQNTAATTWARIGYATVNSGAGVIFNGASTQKNWVIANQYNVNGGLEFTQTTAGGGSTIGSTPAMVLDSSGNLGLGVTPGGWTTYSALELGKNGGGYIGNTASGGFIGIGNNFYFNGSYRYANNAPASFYYQQSGNHYWNNAVGAASGTAFTFTQAMTLDASGNLLVGTTSATTVNSASPKLVVFSNAGDNIIAKNSTQELAVGCDYVSANTNNALRFATNNTERARITSGGEFLIGQTSGGARLNITAATSQNAVNIVLPSDNYLGATIHSTATSGDNQFMAFGTEASFTTRGSISYNRAGGLTAYNTTSDYRAKDIIGPVVNSGATIDALKVYEGKMKGATQARPMMVAHEAQAVVPFCVSGVKDETNEDGTPKYQQMDHASLVPLLIAELQSLRARVAQLEAK